MNDIRYRVLFKGEVAVGADIDEVKRKLATTFKIASDKIDKMFSGGKTILKKNSTLDVCEKTKSMIEKTGAVCYIESEANKEAGDISSSQLEEPKPPPLPSREELDRRAAAEGRRTKKADEKFCTSCGEIIQIKMLSCPYCGTKLKKEGMGCLPIAAIVIGISIVVLAILGILAAIAIPNFVAYRERSNQAGVRMELKNLAEAEAAFHQENDRYTTNLNELQFSVSNPQVSITVVNADENCFDAKGETDKLKKVLWIDCNGNLEVQQKEP